MPPRTALAILVAAFVVLGLVFCSVTPYRQAGRLAHQGGVRVPDIGAPDERQHANYVSFVLDGKGFPVLRPGSPDLIETYQSHQPPLYYLLAAGWAKFVGADPSSRESGGRLRWLSVLIGAGTLMGVYCAAKWGTGRDEVALCAVAFTGLMPMFVALNSAVSNDPLAYLACAWTMALCAKGLREGWDWQLAAWIGVVVGLGLLTKTTALALIPTVAAALAASRIWTEHRPCLRVWSIAMVLPLVVASPWMVRNTNLYGDPFAIQAFQDAFVGSPRPQDVVIPTWVMTDPVYNQAALEAQSELPFAEQRELIDRIYEKAGGLSLAAKFDYWTDWVGWWVSRSYVGVLGYMDVFILEGESQVASDTFYRVVLVALAICALGWAIGLRGLTGGAERAFHLVGAVLVLAVLVMFVRFNLVYFQGQARYLYPAVAPISIGLACGLAHWLKERRKQAWLVAAACLLAVDFLALSAMSTAFSQRAL